MFRRVILAALVAVAVAAGPASKPASRPATRPAGVAAAERELAAAQQRAAAATAAVEKARADGVRRLEASPAFKDALAELAGKQKALDKARASGTPQEKLNASAAFTKARRLVEKMRADSVDKDDVLKKAVAAKSAADVELVRAGKRAAAEREENDPVNVAIRQGKFIKGMTESQAGQVMARFPVIATEKKVEDSGNGEKLIHWSQRDVTTGDVVRRVTLVLRNGVVESVTEKRR